MRAESEMNQKQISLNSFENGLYILSLYRGASAILNVGPRTAESELEMFRIIDNLVTGMEIFLRLAFPDFEVKITRVMEKVGRKNYEEDVAQLLRQTRLNWHGSDWSDPMKKDN